MIEGKERGDRMNETRDRLTRKLPNAELNIAAA